MADAIIPDHRAPTPAANTAQGAPKPPTRDYPAEHARREERAREEGFASYWDKRKARYGPDPRYDRRHRAA